MSTSKPPRSKNQSPAPARPGAKPADDAPVVPPYVPRAPADALAFFRADAEALADDQVKVCRADPAVVAKNVAYGLEALAPDLHRLPACIPGITVRALYDLADLAAALEHAAAAVLDAETLGDAFEAKLARLRELREPMLTQLEILAQCYKSGATDEASVAARAKLRARAKAIRAGQGDYDAARDGVQIAEVFRDYEEDFAEKHPFTAEQIAELDALGRWLMARITPKGARKFPDRDRADAADLRDRLWTLLVARHPAMRRAGFYFHTESIDEHVPLLLSRVAAGGAADEKPAPTPPEPPR